MSEQIDSTMTAEPEFKQVINKKGMPEKSAEEEAKLLEDVVTYVQYDEMVDFEADHPFMTGAAQYLQKDMIQCTLDKELWREQFDLLDILRRI